MKKVIVIVSEDTTEKEMVVIRDAFKDPDKQVIVANESCVKQVVTVDFNDFSVKKQEG